MKNLLLTQLVLLGILLAFIVNSCKQNFPEVEATGFSIDQTEVVVMVGDITSVRALILPENASNKKMTWSSSDPEIATVNVKGEIKGIKEGETHIIATLDGGRRTASCKVYVTTKVYEVISVKLDVKDFVLNIGESRTLVATILPENAANKIVSWQSADESIATVDENGIVTPLAEGETVIMVTTEDGGKTASSTLTVTQRGKVAGITLNTELLALLPGESLPLVAAILPEDAVNKEVLWQSDNPAIATVDAAGIVTGVASGTTIVTATTVDQGKTAQVTVRVGVVFKDDYNRTNTSWAGKNTAPNPIGTYWSISDGYFQIVDQRVKAVRMTSDITPPTTPLQGSIFYRAPGATMKNVEGSFKLSADMIVESTTGWVGFILNAQDDNRFYVLRIRGDVGKGAIQFLATADGGTGWTVISSKDSHPDLSPGVYNVVISSDRAGRFIIKITKNGSVYYEGTIEDAQARYSNGNAGFFITAGSDAYVLYDNFSLEVR